MKKAIIPIFGSLLLASSVVQAENAGALNCVQGSGLNAQAWFNDLNNSVFVLFEGELPPETEVRITTLKNCLDEAGNKYSGEENIRGEVGFNDLIDTELAETYYIYFDRATQAVKQEETEHPY